MRHLSNRHFSAKIAATLAQRSDGHGFDAIKIRDSGPRLLVQAMSNASSSATAMASRFANSLTRSASTVPPSEHTLKETALRAEDPCARSLTNNASKSQRNIEPENHWHSSASSSAFMRRPSATSYASSESRSDRRARTIAQSDPRPATRRLKPTKAKQRVHVPSGAPGGTLREHALLIVALADCLRFLVLGRP